MERNLRKKKIGVVVSDKMTKTVVVEVLESYRHPKYEKIVKKTKRFKAHDENEQCKLGDKVLIYETRKLSKDKNWRVAKILDNNNK